MFTRLRSRLAGFTHDEDGNSTIEFIILFPIFFTLFVSMFESGYIMTRYVMLEHGMDVAVREIRLSDDPSSITHDSIKTVLCNAVYIVSDCENTLQLEMVVVDEATWDFPSGVATCIDRESDIDPTISFATGAEQDIMYMRACLVIDPMFTTIGLGSALTLDDSGGLRLYAASAFATEPT
jgi:Flp pilus assembly protein TadG